MMILNMKIAIVCVDHRSIATTWVTIPIFRTTKVQVHITISFHCSNLWSLFIVQCSQLIIVFFSWLFFQTFFLDFKMQLRQCITIRICLDYLLMLSIRTKASDATIHILCTKFQDFSQPQITLSQQIKWIVYVPINSKIHQR